MWTESQFEDRLVMMRDALSRLEDQENEQLKNEMKEEILEESEDSDFEDSLTQLLNDRLNASQVEMNEEEIVVEHKKNTLKQTANVMDMSIAAEETKEDSSMEMGFQAMNMEISRPR